MYYENLFLTLMRSKTYLGKAVVLVFVIIISSVFLFVVLFTLSIVIFSLVKQQPSDNKTKLDAKKLNIFLH